MDSGDLSLPVPPVSGPPAPSAGPASPPVARSYPSQARPATVAPATTPASTHTPTGGNPFGSEQRDGPVRSRLHRVRKRIGSAFAGLVALIAKFWIALKALLVALPNLKLLVTAGTALVSVAAYSLWFGWTFAAGFVILIFIHEMGHVIALRREGIKASTPMFIPFMGAAIFSKSLGDNALAEARVGLAGPILGTVGSGVCLVIAEVTNSDFFRALAYIGFFINLFNLLPVVPLDGGRAMAAMAPWMWFLGLGVLVVLDFVSPNFILLIITLFAVMELYRRWQARKLGSMQQAAYYRVAPRHRLLVGAVYIGLIVVLALGMDATHILSSGGHSFRSI